MKNETKKEKRGGRRMIIHCEINRKSDLKLEVSQNAYKVEFKDSFYIDSGYWAKWYGAYDRQDAKNKFNLEYPNRTYCRTLKK